MTLYTPAAGCAIILALKRFNAGLSRSFGGLLVVYTCTNLRSEVIFFFEKIDRKSIFRRWIGFSDPNSGRVLSLDVATSLPLLPLGSGPCALALNMRRCRGNS